jgi:hypothetical protein
VQHLRFRYHPPPPISPNDPGLLDFTLDPLATPFARIKFNYYFTHKGVIDRNNALMNGWLEEFSRTWGPPVRTHSQSWLFYVTAAGVIRVFRQL